MTLCVRMFCLFVLTLLLSACNGASSDNSSEPSIAQSPNSIVITLLNSQQQVNASYSNDENITIAAVLLDNFNQPISGQVINFAASLGSLNKNTGLTDSQGRAVVELNSTGSIGAGTISATINSISAEANFEFNQAPTVVEKTPILTLIMTVNNSVNNRLTQGENAVLTVKLVNGQGEIMADRIVTLAAEIGTLNVQSALTDNSGEVNFVLTAGNEDLGAGVLTVSTSENSDFISSQLNYEILAAAPTSAETIQVGHFDEAGVFIEGVLGISGYDSEADVTITAGSSLGVLVALIDSTGKRVLTPTQVSFTSNCVSAGLSTINATALTINGVAQATFTDTQCAGSDGTDDIIAASVVIDDQLVTLSRAFSIASEQVGSISFMSATPESIVLKGTGGVNKSETSVLTFKVMSALGNDLANQLVTFALNSTVGGVSLNHESSYTNSEGLVSVTVKSGTAPTVVRVNASTNNDGNIISTQSDLLTVNTGLPDQDSITIAASTINIEDINGVTTDITAYMSDAFNNPVPDGTTVKFSAEGGSITSSCNTVNGNCSVTWTATEPRVTDNRITVLATAVGHETFFDNDGNNVFNSTDGSAIVNNNVASGFDRASAQTSGFIDMSEAWRDDNENRRFDTGEKFDDFNDDQQFSAADGKFSGPQCEGSLCGNSSINVRKAMVLITATSTAKLALTSGNTNYGSSNQIAFAANETKSFSLTFSDLANQILPAGTSIQVSADVGELKGQTSFTVANSVGSSSASGFGGSSINFDLLNKNDSDTAESGFLTIEATSPSGVKTNATYRITLANNN